MNFTQLDKMRVRRRLSAPRTLVADFAAVILIGAFLLWLPVSQNPGSKITFFDALFEATSAVCVTGLSVVTVSETFNLFGRTVMAALMQIGGMGVVLMGISFLIAARAKMKFRTKFLFVQAQNLTGYKDLARLARIILAITFAIEAIGALALFFALLPYYPPLKALGHAAFLSISAFNNAGFDTIGDSSLMPFASDVWINLIISILVILGGFGFLAMIDVFKNRKCPRKLQLTTKIVLMMTLLLLVFGTIFLKATTSMTWMESAFQSVIARTAGFATVPVSEFTTAGTMVFTILMFIGASPNSTGGGMKTTTVFVAGLKVISSTTKHDENSVFHRRISELDSTKAFTVLYYGAGLVLISTFIICAAQPEFSLSDVIVEVVSAIATVGSSAGITADLNGLSRVVIIICMFIGRLGPITIANLLVSRKEHKFEYTTENVLIG